MNADQDIVSIGCLYQYISGALFEDHEMDKFIDEYLPTENNCNCKGTVTMQL